MFRWYRASTKSYAHYPPAAVPQVTGTGTVTLGGDVLGVGGVPAKVRCAAGLKDCHKVVVEAPSRQNLCSSSSKPLHADPLVTLW